MTKRYLNDRAALALTIKITDHITDHIRKKRSIDPVRFGHQISTWVFQMKSLFEDDPKISKD
jgi:hypothetical protein